MESTICRNAAAYLAEMRDLLGRMDVRAIDTLAAWTFRAWADDQTVLTFGNGGSALTASHFITDLVKTASVDGRRRLRALSLTDNIGLLTAIGNDIDYSHTFAHQLESMARPGDIAIAISASGNSSNVVEACSWAKRHDVQVVALTGFQGGRLSEMADLHIHVPSDNYGLVEDLHLSVGHIVSQSLRSMILCQGTTS